MKTALDWLIEQMPYEFRANHTQEIFKQAKEKEKEQIIFDYMNGKYYHQYEDITAEEYYNQTYNQNI
jgi:hypothetical protein